LTVLESGAVVLADQSKVKEHCVDKRCDPAGLAAGQEGKTFSTINTIAWPVALTGSALAIYLFASNRAQPKSGYALRLNTTPGQVGVLLEGNTR
jgi:hypothetical protein